MPASLSNFGGDFVSNKAELTSAYITLIPSMEGSQGAIASAILPQAGKAGDEAGLSMGSRLSKGLTGQMGKLLTVAAISGAFVGLYKIGEVFDDLTDTIRIGTGAQGAALDGLVDVAKNVGRVVPAEFSNIGPVVADLNTRLGLSGVTLEKVASQYLEAGRILGEDIDIQKTSAAFSVFKIEGDEVSGAMDHLFRVSQATGLGINELASKAQAAAPTVSLLGWGFEETTAFIGKFDKAGLDSSKMMAAMSKGLVTMAKDGEEPAEVFPRVIGELESMIASGDTAAALDLASGIFGTRGAAQFIAAVESGELALSDLANVGGMTGDTILGVAGETADFAEKWQIVKNNAMLALEPLGSAVFSALGDALGVALPYLQDMGKWLSDNTSVIGVFATVIGVTLVAAMFAWAASIWATTFALLANPVTWVVLAVVALIAALVLLIMNWDAVVVWVTEAWGSFLAWFQSVGDAIAVWWNGLWAGIGQWVADTWASIKSAVSGAFDAVFSYLMGVGSAISNWWNGLWSAIGRFISDTWKNIQNWVKSGIDGVVGFFRGLPSGIASAISNIANTISAPFKAAFNAVASFWNSTVGQLSWSIPDWVPLVGGNTISVPKLPMLATGGTALAAGWSIIGELGPELMHVPTGASVVPLDHPAAVNAYTRPAPLPVASPGGGSGAGGSWPESVKLVIGDREFTAYLSDEFGAGGSVVSALGAI